MPPGANKVALGPRHRPHRRSWVSSAMRTPMAVGADKVASAAMPTRAHLRTSSWLPRLDSSTKPGAACGSRGFSWPVWARWPMSLSRALWRPTSSITCSTCPLASAQAAACTDWLAWCKGCWWYRACMAASTVGASTWASQGAAGTGGQSRSRPTKLSTPQTPQPVRPLMLRRLLCSRAMQRAAICRSTCTASIPSGRPTHWALRGSICRS